MNILLLCADVARKTGTVKDHIQAFETLSAHNIVVVDSIIGETVNVDLFDGVVFHYSIVISMSAYLSENFTRRLATFSGLKILFIQDEFRWVDRTAKAAERLGISAIFTVVNKDAIRKIYRHDYFDDVRFEQTLTGFVPEHLLDIDTPSYAQREVDVVYRARKLPAWCGSFAQQKWRIGARFEQDAKAFGLKTDIAMSEASRIYGDAWIRFLSNARATLGTESGASFVDYSGQVIPAVDAFEASHPNADFAEVRDRFLEGRDGEVTINVISPRVFEAAALRTLMILYPGEYSNIIQPGQHYVELNFDHSNMAEVVSIMRDPDQAGAIVDRAYREIADSGQWTFQSFIAHFDAVVTEMANECGIISSTSRENLSDHLSAEAVLKAQALRQEQERIAREAHSNQLRLQRRQRYMMVYMKYFSGLNSILPVCVKSFIKKGLNIFAKISKI